MQWVFGNNKLYQLGIDKQYSDDVYGVLNDVFYILHFSVWN